MSAPVSDEDARALNRLLGQLSPRAKERTHREFDEVFNRAMREQGAVAVVRDQSGLIVATASLLVTMTLMESLGHIEDVVVDEKHRGRGLGEELMAFLIRRAK